MGNRETAPSRELVLWVLLPVQTAVIVAGATIDPLVGVIIGGVFSLLNTVLLLIGGHIVRKRETRDGQAEGDNDRRSSDSDIDDNIISLESRLTQKQNDSSGTDRPSGKNGGT